MSVELALPEERQRIRDLLTKFPQQIETKVSKERSRENDRRNKSVNAKERRPQYTRDANIEQEQAEPVHPSGEDKSTRRRDQLTVIAHSLRRPF